MSPPAPHRAAALPRERRLEWVAQGTRRFLADVAELEDGGFVAPSLLPGWSRAHVVAHVALNGEAIDRLAAWATTGVETPMYPDVATRNADIDELAALAPDAIVQRLERACAQLDAAVAAMPEEAWAATVRSARGREIPAEEILWMRSRELWLHAVDLDAGTGLDALPEDLLEALVSDVVDVFALRGELAGMRLVEPAEGRVWELGPGTDDREVTLPLPALAGWLTGRTDPATLPPAEWGAVPAAPRWL